MSGKVLCGATLRGSETGRLDPGHKCHYRAVAGAQPPRCRLHGGISERHLRAVGYSAAGEAIQALKAPLSALSAPKVRILHDSYGVWSRVELNGELFCEGHSFDERDFVKLLQTFGVEVTRRQVLFHDGGGYVEGEDLD